MPQEIGYRSQLGPAQPVALPDASPNAFGAGIGAGIDRLGASLEQYEQVKRDLAYNEELATSSLGAEKLKNDFEERERQADVNNPGDLVADFDQRREEFLGTIQNKRVRENLTARLEAYRGDVAARTEGREIARAARTSATAGKDYRFQMTNRAIASDDPNALPDAVHDYEEYANAVATTPEIRKALLAEGREIQVDFATAKASSDPALARKLVASPLFRNVDPAVITRITHIADAQQHVVEAQARAVATAEKTAMRETLATRRAELDGGAGKPQDWGDLARAYEAIGDTSSAVTARASGTAMMAGLSHKGDSLAAIDARVAALDAKQGGAGLSAGEAAELRGLTTLRGQKAARLGQPGGALLEQAFATGRPIAPIDLNDAASLRQRAQQAVVAAQIASRATVEPFTATDLPGLKDLMEKGAGGQVQVLRTLAGLGDPRAIDGAARQVSGAGEGAFRIAARMLTYPEGQAVAEAVIRGDEMRRKAPWPEMAQAQARKNFAAWYGPALRGGRMPVDYANDLLDASTAYFTSRSNGGAYDAGRHAEAIDAVLGKNGGRGGVARTKQGIVLVPPTMTPADLMHRFSAARGGHYTQASGGRVPVWSDATPISAPQLRTMLPTMLADGRYGFRGQNGELVHDDRGGIYAVDAARLPAR